MGSLIFTATSGFKDEKYSYVVPFSLEKEVLVFLYQNFKSKRENVLRAKKRGYEHVACLFATIIKTSQGLSRVSSHVYLQIIAAVEPSLAAKDENLAEREREIKRERFNYSNTQKTGRTFDEIEKDLFLVDMAIAKRTYIFNNLFK